MNDNIKMKLKHFIFLTFLISWTCFGLIIIAKNFGYMKYGTPLFMIIYTAAGNASPIVTYLLLKKYKEIKSIKEFINDNFKFKSSAKNYLLMLIFLILNFSISIMFNACDTNIVIPAILIMVPMNILLGGLEEIGWRGFFQYNLEKMTSFISATITTSVLWSLWHLPLWFIPGTVQENMSFIMFSIAIFGMTFMLSAIRKVSNNIWICILFHSCINSFTALLSVKQGTNTILTSIIEILLSILIVRMVNKKVV